MIHLWGLDESQHEDWRSCQCSTIPICILLFRTEFVVLFFFGIARNYSLISHMSLLLAIYSTVAPTRATWRQLRVLGWLHSISLKWLLDYQIECQSGTRFVSQILLTKAVSLEEQSTINGNLRIYCHQQNLYGLNHITHCLAWFNGGEVGW